MKRGLWITFGLVIGLSLPMTGCGDSSTSIVIDHVTTHVLTVNSANAPGGVTASASPADNNNETGGNTSFTRTYNAGTSVTLTAPATSGISSFVSWSGCTSSGTTTCTVALNSDATVTANYAAPSSTQETYTLTVNSTNPGSGVAVGVAPADNNNSAGGDTSLTRTYNTGATVTLTAPATAGGNTFTSWSGCTTSSTTSCIVTLNSDTTVTANYAAPAPTPTPTPTTTTYMLTVNSTNPGSGVAVGVAPADNNDMTNGDSSFTRIYNAGATVTLTAPATAGGNSFASWSGCTASSTTNCTVALNSDTTVTANYAASTPTPAPTPITTYVLTVNSTHPSSGVAVGVAPADNNNTSDGNTSFNRTYNAGTFVTLTAPATSGGSTFASWSGCTTSSATNCTVALNSNKTVTANYAAPAPITTYMLTVNSTNPGSGVAVGVAPADNNDMTNGDSSFTRTYDAGTRVTLTAPATAGGNSFVSWSGCTASSTASCIVALNADTTVTANYAAPSPTPTPTPITTYVLTVNSTNPGSGVAVGVTLADNNDMTDGDSSFTRTYNAGTTVTLMAPATAGGNPFVSWSGCTASGTTNCTVALNSNTTVTANYAAPAPTPTPAPAPITTYVLTVNSTNPGSGVAVGVAPADNNNAASGTTSFTRTYNAGTSVMLIAPAVAGGEPFLSWTGCTTTSTIGCTVVLNSNATVTANYVVPAPPAPPTTYTLIVNSTNPNSGVVIGVAPADNNNAAQGNTNFTRTYNAGMSVTLVAPAVADGDPFVSWTGCTASTSVTCAVTLNSNSTVTANYLAPPPTPETYELTVNSTNPANYVEIGVTPADNNETTNGTTSFALTYNSGTVVTLTAPSTASGNNFSSWTGCSSSSAFTCTVSLNSNTTVTANYAAPPGGNSYYLATAADGGNDSNDGLSPGSPWLSPNHPLNCGDTIIAAASTAYDQSNFEDGQWGTVTCSPGATANVAWLKCAVFDGCKLTATNQNGMWVTSSYWGVQGWEVTATGSQAVCFAAFPPTSTANIHHIIFANDIANGCYGAGFEPVPNGSAGVDYFVLIGSIAYNAAQQSVQCGSGVSIFEPSESDQLPGTHIYVAGNYAWDNFEPSSCAGGTPTDGEGFIFDTLDGHSYTQQAVMEDNISFLNGASGFRVDMTTMAPVYLVNNTSFGNNGDTQLNSSWCGEFALQESQGIQVYNNIAMTNSASGCGANPNYAFYVADGNDTDVVQLNLAYAVAGQNSGENGSTGFSFAASNMFGINPEFAAAPLTNPGAPSCSSAANVAACMATQISGFVPAATDALGLGFIPPSETVAADPLFPQWLCNTNLPSGLIPDHCS